MIETHSDYLNDRVRIDVRDKKNIRREDVVILYFERDKEKHKNGVKIFPIFLDELGNLIDAPPTYRQFFLEESRFGESPGVCLIIDANGALRSRRLPTMMRSESAGGSTT